MKRVEIPDSYGEPILIATNKRLADAVLATRLRLLMACGGKGLCATCHVYVEKGAESLSPVTPREAISLRMLSDRKPCSRLSCQAKVTGDGIQVRLPQGRYLESTTDLESLIGRRAEQAILHPVTGALLIAEGKIVTRSRLRELSSVDVDIAEMKTRSLTIDGVKVR